MRRFRSTSTPSTRLLSLGCFGLLLATGPFLGGCSGGSVDRKSEQTANTLQMEVAEVDQLSSLGNKIPDGQYLVTRVLMRNPSNQSIVLNPQDFVLENMTDNEAERYSQPAEKFMSTPFGEVYGRVVREKLMDLGQANLYPRLQLERYFIFMVPADAKANQYRITYKPLKVSASLVSNKTVVNDRRNNDTTHP